MCSSWRGKAENLSFAPFLSPPRELLRTGPGPNIPGSAVSGSPSGAAGRSQSCPCHTRPGMCESEREPGTELRHIQPGTKRFPRRLSAPGCSQERAAEHLDCGAGSLLTLGGRRASGKAKQICLVPNPARGTSTSKSSRCTLGPALGSGTAGGMRGKERKRFKKSVWKIKSALGARFGNSCCSCQ